MSASAVADDVEHPLANRRLATPGQHRRFLIPIGLLAFVVLLAIAVSRSSAAPQTVRPVHNNPTLVALATTPDIAGQCPWLARTMKRNDSPDELARLVTDRMTLDEKLGEIVLTSLGPYENVDSGVARLCIPPLSLQDGPQGLAYGDVNVTQLPAPLGLAATFDVGLAKSYGEVEGEEASGQGFDVMQGPTLNLLRVPENGRAYEGFGEDPLLVSDMGVADVKGIQSRGVMAQAKELVAYSQETDRGALDDDVATRPLEELYLRPFEAAVKQANVASVMCAYPELNGTYQCQDGSLLGTLSKWGFSGFVRSDLGAVHDPAAAVIAGTDLIKPASVSGLTTAIRQGRLPVTAVDTAVERVLASMFAYGVVGRNPIGAPGDPVDTPAHAALSLHVAEQAAVLLKDSAGILPLTLASDRSVAVIGADANIDPVTTGFGSSRVEAPFISTPLEAIRRRAGRSTTVSFSSGGSTTARLPPIPTDVLKPASGQGQGLTFTLIRAGSGPSSVQTVQPSVDTSIQPFPGLSSLRHDVGPDAPVEQRSPDGSFFGGGDSARTGSNRDAISRGRSLSERPTRTDLVLPPGWTDVQATWTGTITPPESGDYTFSLQGSGASTVMLDGVPVVSDPLSHVLGRWSQTVTLAAGVPEQIEVTWDPFDTFHHRGQPTVVNSSLTLGWKYVSALISQAVAAADNADTAIVFAGDYNAESFDRPSLSLPGDENELISAVAAVNPRTIVVLNTGGPVLMPWINQVAGVIEDWYPGEEDGDAVAAVLYGDVDPSGHLPVTFPVSAAQSAIDTPEQWPGINLVSTYSEGLDVGYRYNHATGIPPLFAFGDGLSYTRFNLSRLSVHRSQRNDVVSVRVANVGNRTGTALPQAYLTDPPMAAEPPAQLAAFARVTLQPGESKLVTMTIPSSAFQAYLGNRWTTVPGTYTVSVGQSSASLPLSASVLAPGV